MYIASRLSHLRENRSGNSRTVEFVFAEYAKLGSEFPPNSAAEIPPIRQIIARIPNRSRKTTAAFDSQMTPCALAIGILLRPPPYCELAEGSSSESSSARSVR